MAVANVISVPDMELLISQGFTYEKISFRLKAEYSFKRGLSPMSIRRYCKVHNIGKKCTLSQKELRNEVLRCTLEVGVRFLCKKLEEFSDISFLSFMIIDKTLSTFGFDVSKNI